MTITFLNFKSAIYRKYGSRMDSIWTFENKDCFKRFSYFIRIIRGQSLCKIELDLIQALRYQCRFCIEYYGGICAHNHSNQVYTTTPYIPERRDQLQYMKTKQIVKVDLIITRPDTRLPQSRAGGQGPYLRSLDHLGRSSEVKEIKSQKKSKT